MSKNQYYYNFIYKKDFFSQKLEKIKQKQDIKIIIEFSFKDLIFKSKSYITFFLNILELLTNQKVCFSFSKKNEIYIQVKKKDLVLLFLTLRNTKIYNIIQKYSTFVYQIKNQKGFYFQNNKNNCYSYINLIDLIEIKNILINENYIVNYIIQNKIKFKIKIIFNNSYTKNENIFYIQSLLYQTSK